MAETEEDHGTDEAASATVRETKSAGGDQKTRDKKAKKKFATKVTLFLMISY